MNRRVRSPATVREPRQVRGGTEEAAEHGLGAGMSIGRHFRVRPLKRFEANLVIARRANARRGNLLVRSTNYKCSFVGAPIKNGRST